MYNRAQLASLHPAIPVSLATILAFLYLDSESIWLDEAYSIAHVNLPWSALLSLVIQLETNMSLYHVLLKLWIAVFGDSEFAVRALSAIFQPASVAITYSVAKKLFDTRVAFIAALLLATHTFAIYYAQEARSYSMLLFLSTTSIYVLIEAIANKRTSQYVWLGLVNTAMLYTHLYGAFTILLQMVMIALACRGDRSWTGFLLPGAITVILSLPLAYLVFTAEGNPWAWAQGSTLIRLVLALKVLTGGALFVAIPVSLCVALALISAARKIRVLVDRTLIWKYLLLVLWVGLPIGCLYVLSKFGPAFENRYLITALPAIAILAALGVAAVTRKVGQILVFALLIVVSMTNIATQYSSTSKRDWRTATTTILAKAQHGDAIMFYGWMAKYPFEYYYRQFQEIDHPSRELLCVWPSPFLAPDSKENVDTLVKLVRNYTDLTASQMEAIAASHDRLWVVLAMDKIAGMGLDSGPILEALEREYRVEEEIGLAQIRILKLSKVSTEAT